MNTLTINSKAALVLARATEKAKQVKPRVRKTAVYGVYAVEASDKFTWYTVTCNSATKEITCLCKARKPCYHCSAVLSIHVFIARQKQEAAAQAAQAPAELAGSVQEIEDFITESNAKCNIRNCPSLADDGCRGFCGDCYLAELQADDDRVCIFG